MADKQPSKADALRAMREANYDAGKKLGLRITSLPIKPGPPGDGVALTSMEHPPGLIDKIADAIRTGKLPATPTKLKRGRPTIVAPRPWEAEGMSRRTWYRRKKEQSK
jgi:hypothetical protein